MLMMNRRWIPLSLLVLACGILVMVISQRSSRRDSPQREEPLSITQQSPQKEVILERSADPTMLFGFIRSMKIDGNTVSITLDEAEFIQNRASSPTEDLGPGSADLAMIEDGKCTADISNVSFGECAPNGFYVRSNSPATKTLSLDASTNITVLVSSENEGVYPQSITLQELRQAFLNPSSEQHTLYYALVEGPYTASLNKNTIVDLRSFYLP